MEGNRFPPNFSDDPGLSVATDASQSTGIAKLALRVTYEDLLLRGGNASK